MGQLPNSTHKDLERGGKVEDLTGRGGYNAEQNRFSFRGKGGDWLLVVWKRKR